ncbi:SH3 domain-containing protein [Paracoccus seriniphilus]|uniref:SH3 domain-containing protein n=1 Tax=Paracoccus seriniphilus TaxID=184748 RepID=A0A239Q2E4_9RHOB|nr:hypothetical protein [Paracoccus seriniphilus]SNT76779.1 hypothetical protein SAMN05444959_1287 [Paracoccus seriniphilus]
MLGSDLRGRVQVLAALVLPLFVSVAHAEIDGHGPDAWRVTGVAANDVLNARMGPGTSYPVIETFAHDERGLEEITCVPFYSPAHYMAMSEAEIAALPARWCLMRSADMTRAGWVAQRYLTADFGGDGDAAASPVPPAPTAGPQAWTSDALIDHARDLVAALYRHDDPALGRSPLAPDARDAFFSSDFVAALETRPPGADLLTGAQNFEGTVSAPKPDPDQPMFRGMITITVDVVNFGQAHTVVFRLRGDTTRPNAPLRIFRIEHDGWSFP